MSRSFSAHKLLALLVGAFLASSASAETITVCWDGSGDYLTIQEGIDAALDGDEVVVCDGMYTGDGNRDLDFGGKLIIVRSANGPEFCIIDCQASETDPHRGFYFHSGETTAAVLQGLTIRNGHVEQDTPGRYGGGVYCGSASSPTLSNCTITTNSVYGMGGGVYCSADSSPTLTDCMIAGNSCNFMGAGVYCWGASPTLSNCTITANTAEDWGAGVHCSNNSSPTLLNCTITNNTSLYGYGAGVCCEDSPGVTVTNCTMAGNSAHGGGGVYCYQSSATLTNCVFTGNTATQGYGYGGAVFCFSGANATLTNCTITGNVANYGGAVFCEDSSPTLTNCALWGDDAYSGPEIYLSANQSVSTLTVSYSDVDGGEDAAYVEYGCTLIWGDGNIDQDPWFVDPASDDYHLSDASSCINTGSNYAPELPDGDIEGNPRVQQCRADVGAYESPYPGTFEDCNENGEDDDCDIYEGTSEDCNQNHVPDECIELEDDCNGNGFPDECDIADGISEDCNANGIPDECDIADGTSDDYDLNGVPDECDPDCNDNGIPDACDLDCATGNCASHPLGCGASDDYDLNGIPDECDPDCNGNGILDACDLDCATGNCASHPLGCGASADCQPNGVPDECDIANGSSEDENDNGIPDECEGACQANEVAKLLASDGAAGDELGCSVGISDNTALIGAFHDDDNGADSGSAYVFRYDGSNWIGQAKLLPFDGAADDRFGEAVAISGDTAVIGARRDDDNGENSGAVYVFRFDGSDWALQAKLLPSDGAAGDGFGRSVAISGNTAVIGATGDDDNGTNSGSAYVFRYDGSDWVEEAKLLASDGAASDLFGFSASIYGDSALIGAEDDDDNGDNSGSAYVFRYDGLTWAQEAKLLPADGEPRDYFGCSVAISGDAAVVGAYNGNDNGATSGSAYVFRYDGSNWSNEAKLLASDSAGGDNFGWSVAISGDTAVIGAKWDDDNGEDSGAAYVFRYDGANWVEQAKLLASDGAADDTFGRSVAISGGTAVIGADGDDDNGSYSGSAYVFHGLSDCQPNGTLDICDINNGTSQDCQPNGIPDECDIADGTSEDCQPNGVPDECDIADGTSEDANGNGVPDECEEACVANELAKLLASDGATDDRFGCAVAISGDAALVGAYQDDDNGASSGSAYIFRYDGSEWIQEAKLVPSDGAAGDQFGSSVAISGEIAVIGARYDDADTGSAYVFRYDGSSWVEQAKLLASDGASGDRFGGSVAVFDDTVVVGALLDDDNGGNSGSAYVFGYDGSNWVEEAKLLASDGTAGDCFGTWVAISDDTIAIGAEQDADNGEYSGSAYVFRHDGSVWAQEAKLLASDGAPYDCFGVCVAISGDIALIGANGDDPSGSAYVFHYDGSTWHQSQKLLASDGAAGDSFGFRVAISSDTAMIGASGDDDNGSSSGSAYAFRYNGSTWTEVAKLLASDGAPNDDFGRSVAVSGDAGVIGAYGDDDYGDASGSAYVFRGLSDCQPNGTLDICDINNGTSEDGNGNGVPDECEGPECPGDLDGDSDIDLADLAQLLAHYGMTEGATYADGDIDGDGDVDLSDLAALLAVYGTTCE
jgi:parallel beta-helix repeat protein